MSAAVHGPRRQWVGIDPRKVAECSQAHIAYLVEDAIADICALSNREAALLASQAELVEALERALEAPMLDHSGRKEGVYDIIRAALTKSRTDATGEGA